MGRPYAEVIGDPVAHSKSPLIHGFWLEKLGIDAAYRKRHVSPDELSDYFAEKREDADWRGCNVTIPHKVAAMAFCDTLSPDASRVRAVNCVYQQQSRLIGENTDIDGILEALPEALMPAGSKVGILGTGGAARAAFAACKRREVGSVVSLARNCVAAQALLDEFALPGTAGPLETAGDLCQADVIINATSLGMGGKDALPKALLDSVVNSQAVVFDMVYAPLDTELLQVARNAGLQAVDGLAMLIGQAATAFRLFFGELAPREHDGELRRLLAA